MPRWGRLESTRESREKIEELRKKKEIDEIEEYDETYEELSGVPEVTDDDIPLFEKDMDIEYIEKEEVSEGLLGDDDNSQSNDGQEEKNITEEEHTEMNETLLKLRNEYEQEKSRYIETATQDVENGFDDYDFFEFEYDFLNSEQAISSERLKVIEEKINEIKAERIKIELEQKERKETAGQAIKELEEQAEREAEEQARREAEERARREAEEQAKREAEEQARREAEERARREQENLARKKEAEEKINAEYKKRQEEFERRKAEYGLKGIKDKNEMQQRIENIIARGMEYKDSNPEEYTWIGIINQGYEKFEEAYLKLKELGAEQKLFDSFLNVEGLTCTHLLNRANWLLKIYQQQKEAKKNEPETQNDTQENNKEIKENNILEENATEEVEGSVTEQIVEERTKIEEDIQNEPIEQENNEFTEQDTVTQEVYIPQHMRDGLHMRSDEELKDEKDNESEVEAIEEMPVELEEEKDSNNFISDWKMTSVEEMEVKASLRNKNDLDYKTLINRKEKDIETEHNNSNANSEKWMNRFSSWYNSPYLEKYTLNDRNSTLNQIIAAIKENIKSRNKDNTIERD